MSSFKPTALAVAIAAISCALSVFAVLTAVGSTPVAVGGHPELETRLANLERGLEEILARPAAAPVLGAGGGERTRADIEGRLERLEANLAVRGGGATESGGDGDSPGAAAGAGAADDPPARPDAEPRPKRGTPQHLAWARKRVLDPSLTPLERSDALGEIQKHGPEGYTEDIVQTMVALGQTADAKARENIWRQFDGVRNPNVTSALLQVLVTDPSADVREEAAEALDHHREDTTVRAALEHAAQHDRDQKVRWEALRALRKPMKNEPKKNEPKK